MILIAVAIRDQAVAAFNRPWFMSTRNAAIRAFGEACQDQNPQNGLRNHPDDFALFELGEFDDQTGVLKPLAEGPKQIALAREFSLK